MKFKNLKSFLVMLFYSYKYMPILVKKIIWIFKSFFFLILTQLNSIILHTRVKKNHIAKMFFSLYNQKALCMFFVAAKAICKTYLGVWGNRNDKIESNALFSILYTYGR